MKQECLPQNHLLKMRQVICSIDPCEYNDTKLIGFEENGAIIALSSDKWEQTRVNVSRSVYNWDHFNAARKRVRLQCKTALMAFEFVYKDGSDRMLEAIEGISCLVDDKTPYAVLASNT